MCLPRTRCPKSNQSFASAVAQLIKDKAGKRETNPGLDPKAEPRRANIFSRLAALRLRTHLLIGRRRQSARWRISLRLTHREKPTACSPGSAVATAESRTGIAAQIERERGLAE